MVAMRDEDCETPEEMTMQANTSGVLVAAINAE